MLKQRAHLVARMMLVADLLLVCLGFALAYLWRASYPPPLVSVEQYLWLLAGALPIWAMLLRRFGLYASFRTRPLWAEPWALLKVAFWATLLLGALTFVAKWHYVSRSFVGLFGATACGLLVAERTAIRLLARKLRRRGYNYRNVLVVGTGRRAREIAAIIEEQRHWGLRLVGLVSDGPARPVPRTGRVPVLEQTDGLDRLVREQVVDEVIFAVSRKRLEDLEHVFLLCEELGIRTHVAVNFFPHMIAKVHLEDLRGIPLLTFSPVPTDEFALAVKRAFDVVVSGALIALLSPLVLGIAVAIKLTSPGPVLFKQKRVGLNGRRFTLYKFRSMVRDAEARKADLLHLNEMRGPAFKIANDPRLTPIGRLLRRTSLDELPQLFNVLRGDMSIVGPRPPLPDEVAQYQLWQRRRLSMKPGLTCLWQVNGRSKVADFDRWMRMDLQYIDSWSLKLDMKICLKTIPVVLLGKGAA